MTYFLSSKSIKTLSVIASIVLFTNCKKSDPKTEDPKKAFVSTFAGNSSTVSVDGTGIAAGFNYLGALTFDKDGNLFALDGSRKIRKVTSAGVVTTFYDSAGAAFFSNASDLLIDGSGNIVIATSYGAISKITSAGTAILFAGGVYNYGDGKGTGAGFGSATGIVADATGNIYVVDYGNVSIRKITSDATVTTFVGNRLSRTTADGTGTAASFSLPFSICIDSKGNFFVTDQKDNYIRKITPAGVVTTFAGNGQKGAIDGTGSSSSFSSPEGIAVDGNDNLYVADTGNRQIRKITPNGVVTTVAGVAGQIGHIDGAGETAVFIAPYDVATDASGNVYVADGSYIRKIEFK